MDVSAKPALPVTSSPAWLRPQALDRIEQVLVAILWIWLLRRVLHSPNAYAPLLLLSEPAVMLFVLAERKPFPCVAWWCFLIGIFIFSGSLYALALTNIRWLGAITPVGGVLFLIGWAMLFKPAK